MNFKIIGALVVTLACWSIGMIMVVLHKYEVRSVESFIDAIRYMRNELKCRSTPLPQLCTITSEYSRGCMKSFLLNLSAALESQVCPEATQCALHAIADTDHIPESVQDLLSEFGKTLGIFDLKGQLDGLETVERQAEEMLKKKVYQQDIRIRNYHTFGLCAGAALAILFV